jgi:DNA-binding beta-propeller fold protein YncE
MHLRISLFLLCCLSACGGEDHVRREPEAVEPPVANLEFVAGQLGGKGNADGPVGRFSHPIGIAVSDTGVVYVKDGNGGPIRKISPDGAVSSILSTAQDTAWFQMRAGGAMRSSSLALDRAGNLFVVGHKSCQIQRLSPNGEFSVVAGQSDCGYIDGNRSVAKFGRLDAIASDRFGNIYIVDADNFVVRKMDVFGNVSTVTGQVGKRGYIDGGKSQASFFWPDNWPVNIAVNPDGTIYISDVHQQTTIRKISSDGTVSTLQIKNEDGLSMKSLSFGSGMVTDSVGNLFILNQNEILKITPSGISQVFVGGHLRNQDGYGNVVGFRTSAIGAGDDGEGMAYRPIGRLAIDKQDNLYYADTFDSSIRKIRPDTWVTTIAGKYRPDYGRPVDGIGALAKFSQYDFNGYYDERFLDHELRYDLDSDDQGNIIVRHRDQFHVEGELRKVEPNGTVTSLHQWNGVHTWPDHVAADGTKYYVSEDRISRIKPNDVPSEPGSYEDFAGSTSMFADPQYEDPVDGKGGDAVFFTITASTIDKAGNLFVIDRDRLRVQPFPAPWDLPRIKSDREEGGLIRKITPDGVVTTVAGSLAEHGYVDGPGKLARFHVPTSIVADKLGNLWVADTYNHVIRKIDSKGIVSTFAGTAQKSGAKDGMGLQASFYKPDLLILDREGNLLVADSGNCLIRKITPVGKVTTIAGKAGSRGVIPGKLPASLSAIHGMTLDANNTLYIFSERALLKIAL